MSKGIYGYFDRKTNEIVYVGKDSYIHVDKRHRIHMSPSCYDKQKFNRVLQNNPDRYIYQVLVWDVVDEDTLNALEIQYIRQLNPKFNFTEGGDGVLGFKHSEETKQKMSEARKRKYIGENHPNVKYKLWDVSYIKYNKFKMFEDGREPNPCKCFTYKYKGYHVPIGGFHDFVSCEIIDELVLNSIGREH